MHFDIRESVSSDAGALTTLSNQLGYAISEKATLQNLEAITRNADEIIAVALHKKEVVGWIHFFQTTRLESGSFCEIGGLVVNDQYRRMGIGKLLVNHAKDWCISNQIPSLRVRCNTKRTGAHEFYNVVGFAEQKQQKVFVISLPVI